MKHDPLEVNTKVFASSSIRLGSELLVFIVISIALSAVAYSENADPNVEKNAVELWRRYQAEAPRIRTQLQQVTMRIRCQIHSQYLSDPLSFAKAGEIDIEGYEVTLNRGLVKRVSVGTDGIERVIGLNES